MLNPCTFCTATLAYLAISAVHGHGDCGKQRRAARAIEKRGHHDVGVVERATPEALNTVPEYNSIPNVGGPRIYYNGSGNVPGYDKVTNAPNSFTPLSNSDATTQIINELIAIDSSANTYFTATCDKCVASTEVLHVAAMTLGQKAFTNIMIGYCENVDYVYDSIYADTCHAEYSATPVNATEYSSDAGGTGDYFAMLYAKLSMATGDPQILCHYNYGTCSTPAVQLIDESQYFTTKPESAYIVPEPSGETIEVLHLSDWHIDPRYSIGSEGNCSQYLCCRPYATNTDLGTTYADPSVPASRFGNLYCDAPADLALSAFSNMGKFFNKSAIAFTIFTGDIVSHDNDDQISKAYVEYNEKQMYQTFAAQLSGPVYATLGNHDNWPVDFNTPNVFTNGSGASNAMSWDYDTLSSLWEGSGWITSTEASYASTHYGGYAHTTAQGLRVISINSDFYYKHNIYNYFNFTNPDVSGTMQWLATELAAAETAGQRVWIIAHVPNGYDGSQALYTSSALFQSIVVRFSPATIAAVFFGHTHEDQLQLFYDYADTSISTSGLRNTTDIDYTKPLCPGFIGPSITPISGLNSGYQRLQVDSKTFSVMGVQSYFANMSDSLDWTAPVWEFEYDARDTYSVEAIGWPATSPLNATFYHLVTEQMLVNQSLVEAYNLYETKSSVTTESCSTAACAEQVVCYIRSGSAAVGKMCP